MGQDPELILPNVLHEYVFRSSVPLIGSLIVRLRSAWYNVAARWGDQSIISQQMAYNQVVARQIVELTQYLTELDQRVIQADHDLTDLTHTVAELTQQVIELRHLIEQAQAA